MKACMNVQGDRIHLQLFYIKELRGNISEIKFIMICGVKMTPHIFW